MEKQNQTIDTIILLIRIAVRSSHRSAPLVAALGADVLLGAYQGQRYGLTADVMTRHSQASAGYWEIVQDSLSDLVRIQLGRCYDKEGHPDLYNYVRGRRAGFFLINWSGFLVYWCHCVRVSLYVWDLFVSLMVSTDGRTVGRRADLFLITWSGVLVYWCHCVHVYLYA